MIPIPEPIAQWLAAQDALSFVLTVAGIMGIIWAGWKFAKAAFPGVKKLIAFLDALAGLPRFMAAASDRLDRQEALLHEVKHEVLPNNGGSMRDAQDTMGLRVEKIEAKLAKDHQRFDAIEAELRDREARNIGIPASTNPNLRVIQPYPADDTESKEDS